METGPTRAWIPLLAGVRGVGGVVLGGLDLDTLLRRSLVDPHATHVTSDQHTLLMLNSIDMTGDEAHALGAGRLNHGFASLGLRTMLSTSTLGAALEVLARYFATCSSVIRMRIDHAGDFTEVSLRADEITDVIDLAAAHKAQEEGERAEPDGVEPAGDEETSLVIWATGPVSQVSPYAVALLSDLDENDVNRALERLPALA